MKENKTVLKVSLKIVQRFVSAFETAVINLSYSYILSVLRTVKTSFASIKSYIILSATITNGEKRI